jgi:hypothetical protein
MWIILLGHDLDPRFQQDFRAVLARQKRCGLQRMGRRGLIAEGRFTEVCGKWGWTIVDDGVVHTQLGELDLTKVTRSTLLRHATIGWQWDMLEQDNRTKGLDCKHMMPVMDAHAHMIYNARCWEERWVPLGASTDVKEAQQTGQHQTQCKCGVYGPTRKHWMWNCVEYPTTVIPANQAQESLAIRFVDPPTAHLRHKHVLDSRVVNIIRRAMTDGNGRRLLGTDGSSLNQAAAGWGVACKADDGSFIRAGGKVLGADQTSFCSELAAMALVTKALSVVQQPIRVLCDNKGAVQTLSAHLRINVELRCLRLRCLPLGVMSTLLQLARLM